MTTGQILKLVWRWVPSRTEKCWWISWKKSWITESFSSSTLSCSFTDLNSDSSSSFSSSSVLCLLFSHTRNIHGLQNYVHKSLSPQISSDTFIHLLQPAYTHTDTRAYTHTHTHVLYDSTSLKTEPDGLVLQPGSRDKQAAAEQPPDLETADRQNVWLDLSNKMKITLPTCCGRSAAGMQEGTAEPLPWNWMRFSALNPL